MQPLPITYLRPGDVSYPARLTAEMGGDGTPTLATIGNVGLLKLKSVAVLCSIRCPGHLILGTYGFIQTIRDKDLAVIGGFHSPLEKECLRLLLRNNQPVIICMAKTIEGIRIPTAWKSPLAEQRLVIVSPFDTGHRRATAGMAEKRNRFVVALADELFVPHAVPGGKTEAVCRQHLAAKKNVVTLESPDNHNLISAGAKVVRVRMGSIKANE